jgi:CRP/FNR family transcriptional regulator, dissimilatory nitrate respiration regulator
MKLTAPDTHSARHILERRLHSVDRMAIPRLLTHDGADMMSRPRRDTLRPKSHLAQDTAIHVATLATLPLFCGLPVTSLQALARRTTVRRYAAREVLWTAGSPIDRLVIVLAGQVRALRGTGARQHVIHTEGPGGTLGEVALFGGGSAPATVVAATAVRGLVLTRAALEDSIAEDSALAWLFLRRLAARIRTLVDRLDTQTVDPVTTRLARFLLDRHAMSESNGPLTVGMSQREIAEELGTVREMVVRALRTLRQRGAVAPAGRGRLAITNLAALRRAAGDNG